MGADRVEEVTVVRHDEYGILEVRQVVFEPCHGVEVKVVGRFVEQEVVGVAEERLREEHAHLLVGAHVAHEHAVAVFLNTEAAQEGSGVALGIPAFELGETFLKLGCAYTVGVAEVFFSIESVFLLHDIPKHRVAAEDGLEHSAVVKFEVVLFEHAHALARTLRDSACRGGKLPRQHAHES